MRDNKDLIMIGSGITSALLGYVLGICIGSTTIDQKIKDENSILRGEIATLITNHEEYKKTCRPQLDINKVAAFLFKSK